VSEKNWIDRLQSEKKISGLFLLVIGILAVGFVITTGLSYLLTRDYVVSTSVGETLPLVSKNIYTAIMEDLIDPINISSLMANDSFLIEWVNSGERDGEEISAYLGLIKESYGFSSAFFVSDKTGNYYTADGILKQISPEDTHDVWYYQFLKLNQETDLDVDTDQADQDSLTVFINHRLETPEDGFLGVTGVGLLIGDVSAKLESYEEIFKHTIYFIDGDGLIQIHSNRDLIEKKSITEDERLGELGSEIFTKSETPQYYEVKDLFSETVFSIRYFPEFDWYLVVEKDQGPSLSFLKGIFWKTISIGLAVSLLVALIIIRLIKVFHSTLAIQARIDPLTGILNRRALMENGEREVNLAHRHQRPLTVLMIDIVDFKSVNESFGHLVGDEFLAGIAGVFRDTLRSTDLIGRWGGDEFVLVLVENGRQEALEVRTRLKKNLDQFQIKVSEEHITRDIHIGLATLTDEADTFYDLVEKADQSLLQDKLS